MQEKNPNPDFIKMFSDGFDSGISVEKLFVTLYNKPFHSYSLSGMFNIEKFLNTLKEEFNIDDSAIIMSKESSKQNKLDVTDIESSIYIIQLKPNVLLELRSFLMEFYYSEREDKEFILQIARKVNLLKRKKKHKKKFYMLARSRQSENGFELQKFKIKKMKVNIELNYNDDFKEVHEGILNFLKEKDKNGIVMLHGKYGTGKSTYIRHLLHETNNRFIFLPLHLVNELSSPELLPFLTRFPKSVLILEDCEDLLRPRSMGNYNQQALANLLNLGDGLLSDALSLKIICTFNAELQKIDPAILRKGRLAARYNFEELNVNKAKKIAEEYNIDIDIKKPMTLAELFNYKQNDFSQVKKANVGFGISKN